MEQFALDEKLIKEDKFKSERMLKARWNDYVQSKREGLSVQMRSELLREYADLSTKWFLEWNNEN